jgi:5-methylcytosine-specific restriction endonuclease McrA
MADTQHRGDLASRLPEVRSPYLMPIRPENKARYPKDWPAISKRIRERAGDKCEECGVPNGAFRNSVTGDVTMDADEADLWELVGKTVRIVLTVGHRDHQPENCDDENLAAWCQRCHNRYDAPVRAAGIKARRRAANAVNDLFEPSK